LKMRVNKTTGKDITNSYHQKQPRKLLPNTPSCLVFSPQLLCSGAVLRYQFKPYPKPDRTHRPSVKLVTLLALKGAGFIQRGDLSTYQKGVERAGELTREHLI
jgi:hypothetical protein